MYLPIHGLDWIWKYGRYTSISFVGLGSVIIPVVN